MARIRILLADDHTVMRRGLRLLLEQQADFEVVGEADDGRQAVDLAASLHPSVAVLDIGMPLLNGIEATRKIIAAAPAIAVVVLSMHSDETYVLRALDRKSTRLNSSHLVISYAVFCLKKKKKKHTDERTRHHNPLWSSILLPGARG